MSEVVSVRLEESVTKRLSKLARRSRRSKSFLAAEAIAAYLDAEEWQIGEIQNGIRELDRGESVSHEEVVGWLRSWGTATERKTRNRVKRDRAE